MTPHVDNLPVWEGRKVVVCVGTGGVGKTTVSAAIAVAAAVRGLRTLVMTIDPARRLANALGLDRIGNVPREIPADQLAVHGVTPTAPVWALMPDVKRTFDDLVKRWAPNPQAREQIFSNRIYQYFSTALSGTHEYAAVEKLYEVYTAGTYDLIVLDTPPCQNALDFLDAPARIVDFLERDTFQWLLKPYMLAGRFSLKMLDLGSSFILSKLGQMAGADTLHELAEFILAFQGMYEGFRDRSHQVKRLLASEELAFVLVTSTRPTQQEATLRFRHALRGEGLRVRTVVVNRVRPPPCRTDDPDLPKVLSDRIAALLQDEPPETQRAVRVALAEEATLADTDQRAVERLRAQVGETPLITLPELPLDAHDLGSLVQLHAAFLQDCGAQADPR